MCDPANHTDPKFRVNLSGLSGLYSRTGNFTEAQRCAEWAFDLAREVDPSEDSTIACAIYAEKLGTLYAAVGQTTKAVASLERSLHYFGLVAGYHEMLDMERITVLRGLAGEYASVGLHDRALNTIQLAESACRALAGTADVKMRDEVNEELFHIEVTRGDIFRLRGHFEEARLLYRDAIGRGQHCDSRLWEFTSAFLGLGNALEELGLAPEAEMKYSHVVNMLERDRHPRHVHWYARALYCMGALTAEAAQYPRAKEYLEKALALQRAAQPPHHTALAATLTRLSEVYMRLGSRQPRPRQVRPR